MDAIRENIGVTKMFTNIFSSMCTGAKLPKLQISRVSKSILFFILIAGFLNLCACSHIRPINHSRHSRAPQKDHQLTRISAPADTQRSKVKSSEASEADDEIVFVTVKKRASDPVEDEVLDPNEKLIGDRSEWPEIPVSADSGLSYEGWDRTAYFRTPLDPNPVPHDGLSTDQPDDSLRFSRDRMYQKDNSRYFILEPVRVAAEMAFLPFVMLKRGANDFSTRPSRAPSADEKSKSRMSRP